LTNKVCNVYVVLFLCNSTAFYSNKWSYGSKLVSPTAIFSHFGCITKIVKTEGILMHHLSKRLQNYDLIRNPTLFLCNCTPCVHTLYKNAKIHVYTVKRWSL